jgi:DNA polymerase-3 subunit delta'
MPVEEFEAPHPRETSVLFGHAQAEQALLRAYRSGRFPHAWLVGGPMGIGKATLCYRMARFVLAHPHPSAPDVQAAKSLGVDAAHPVARRIAVQAQGDLLALERTEDEKGKLRTVITVDQVRRNVSFFGSTAGEGGWRVCIVDSADELQEPNAANALLKVLEEPPPNALFLLVSHAPAQLLPTIRSRCCWLKLRPLNVADVASAAAAAIGREPHDSEIKAAAEVADGSVARALALLHGNSLALRQTLLSLLDQLPTVDPHALHALGDALGGTESTKLATFVETVNDWMSARLEDGRGEHGRFIGLADAWERINRAARDVDIYNLDRKPLVFSVFRQLAETMRA